MDNFIFWAFKLPFIIATNSLVVALSIMTLKGAWKNS